MSRIIIHFLSVLVCILLLSKSSGSAPPPIETSEKTHQLHCPDGIYDSYSEVCGKSGSTKDGDLIKQFCLSIDTAIKTLCGGSSVPDVVVKNMFSRGVDVNIKDLLSEVDDVGFIEKLKDGDKWKRICKTGDNDQKNLCCIRTKLETLKKAKSSAECGTEKPKTQPNRSSTTKVTSTPKVEANAKLKNATPSQISASETPRKGLSIDPTAKNEGKALSTQKSTSVPAVSSSGDKSKSKDSSNRTGDGKLDMSGRKNSSAKNTTAKKLSNSTSKFSTSLENEPKSEKEKSSKNAKKAERKEKETETNGSKEEVSASSAKKAERKKETETNGSKEKVSASSAKKAERKEKETETNGSKEEVSASSNTAADNKNKALSTTKKKSISTSKPPTSSTVKPTTDKNVLVKNELSGRKEETNKKEREEKERASSKGKADDHSDTSPQQKPAQKPQETKEEIDKDGKFKTSDNSPQDNGLSIVNPRLKYNQKEKTRSGIRDSSEDDNGGVKSSHFIVYGTIGLILLILLYVVYQKRQKILALIVEGRRSRGTSGSERTRRGSGNIVYRPVPTKQDPADERPESMKQYVF